MRAGEFSVRQTDRMNDSALRVIGLMSGTSYDGIDAAVAELAMVAETITLRPLGSLHIPYSEEIQRELAAMMPPAQTTLEAVCRLDTLIGLAFAGAAAAAQDQLGGADLVASHGQTVFHWVSGSAVFGTLQIGQPAWIAERTGLDVVADFRPRDVAAGGQGAPLVSIFDVLWLRSRLLPPSDTSGNPVALNLGGIANLTTGVGAEPEAFDTGPANALIDAAVRHLTSGRLDCDLDGAMGDRGAVDAELLRRLLADPYFERVGPKTTGKEHFHLPYLLAAVGDREIADDDLVATVTALTARTVADAVRRSGGTEVIASGGGTQNPTLMRMLAADLGPVPILTSDELGMPTADKEAYAFAVLGFLTWHGLPGTVPSCTGASHASVLGSITPGGRGRRLPPRPASAPTRLRLISSSRRR